MKNHKLFAMLIAALASYTLTAKGQGVSVNRNDHLFSGAGKSMVTVATGIPYVGITEYSYGFSDRFSAGLIVGVTPRVTGYGVRVRAILHERDDDFRLYLRVPILYYPKTKDLGGEPWILAWPVLSAEWKLRSGARLSAGGGIVTASCFDSMLRKFGLRSHHEESDEEEGFMGGVWNTLHVGMTLPVSERLTFHGEVSAVMSGVQIAGKDWIGGPPVILMLGFSSVL